MSTTGEEDANRSDASRRLGGGAARGGPVSLPPLPSAADEARAFWRMRVRMAATHVRQILSRSRFRLALVVFLTVLLWTGMFWLFADGFTFLKTAIPYAATYDRTVHAVFSMFFAALMVMLVFSSAILLYGALFRAEDVPLLLSLPARIERVFLHKSQESILFSGWAFLLLGSPMLLAYGLVEGAPWYFYALLLPFLIAFTYVPTGIGATCCLLVMRFLPRRRNHVLVATGAIVLVAAIWIAWSFITGPQSAWFTPTWFQQVLARAKFSEQQLLPSWWLGTGLLETARGDWDQGVLFLCLLVANALLFRQLSIGIAGRVYRATYDQVQGKNGRVRGTKPFWADAAIVRFVPAPLQLRLLLAKDFRLFRRDPVQWSQFLVFFALLALYFLNVRRFGSNTQQVAWVNMVSFLNLSVVGLILSTLTTRFIFPMISLEGRRFWILGPLPVRRERIVLSKFVFAVGSSLVPCSLLVWSSDTMLGVPLLVLASHQLTCVLLSLGLSAIAVGLGAKMPNFVEPSPARIAAGFGGTLNLVTSALYILAVVALTALPCHFYLLARYSFASTLVDARPDVARWLILWLVLGTAGSVLLGVAATVLPLRMGFRAFRDMEF